VLLWRLLSVQNIDFFQGQAKWFYYYQYHSSFDASFIRKLRETQWIYIDDKKIAPIEITFEELPEVYKQDIGSAKKFAELLHFRLDEDKEYERNHRGKKVVDAHEWEELQKLKAEKEAAEKAKQEQENDDQKFKPSVSAADAPMNVSDYNGKSKEHPYNKSQNNNSSGDTGKNGESSVSGNADNNNNDKQKNATYIKDVGRWGEEYVYRVLQAEFINKSEIEIIDLNINNKTGVGADFEIRENGDIIKLVEVKSTTSEIGNAVYVSGTQWETAREFYNLQDGEKYWIYCVFNVGQENVCVKPVQNPIKQWKEGKVFADPINFVLE
jgi:hypothetical protein